MLDVGDVVHLPGRDLRAIAVVGPALPQLRRISDIGRADTGELVQLRRQCEAETSAAIGRFIVGSHVSTMRFKPKPRPVLLPWQPVAARKAAG
jgi:hypothetical protein